MARIRVTGAVAKKNSANKAAKVGGIAAGAGYVAGKTISGIRQGEIKKFAVKGIYDTIRSPKLAGLQAAGRALKTSAPAIAIGAGVAYLGTKLAKKMFARRRLSKGVVS